MTKAEAQTLVVGQKVQVIYHGKLIDGVVEKPLGYWRNHESSLRVICKYDGDDAPKSRRMLFQQIKGSAVAKVAQPKQPSWVGKVFVLDKKSGTFKPAHANKAPKAKAKVEQPTERLDVINKMLDKGFTKAEIMALLK